MSLGIYWLVLPLVVGLVMLLFRASSFFLILGIIDYDDLENELSESEKEASITKPIISLVNQIGRVIYTLIGFYLWTLLAIFVSRLVSILSVHMLIKSLVYILAYFFCLRFPFGVAHKMINKEIRLDYIPNRNPFALLMILAFILGIFAYPHLPELFTWPFLWLDNPKH